MASINSALHGLIPHDLSRRPGSVPVQYRFRHKQNTLAQIRRDRLLAYVQLYKALGGGWSLTDAQWKDQEKEMAR